MNPYQELVRSTLENGSYKENRTGVDTISSFHESYTINLQRGFPLVTTKDLSGARWNSLLAELFWYLSGEEHIKTLREETSIWDAWADEDGNLDTAYGRFWRRFPVPESGLEGETWPEDTHKWMTVEEDVDGNKHRTFDQIEYALDQLENNPNSRRIVINAWHPGNATVSTLPPCHFSFVFNVQDGRLNTHLTQRSGDLALGIPFNIAAYSLLTHIVAQEVGLEVGEFGHTIVDAHIYCGEGLRGEWYNHYLPDIQSELPMHIAIDGGREKVDVARRYIKGQMPAHLDDSDNLDHVPGLLKQLTREPRKRPQVEIEDKPLDQLKPEDISLKHYDPHDPIRFGVAE